MAEEEEKRAEMIELMRRSLRNYPTQANWDTYFRVAGSDDRYERCADWTQIEPLITDHLADAILVPACGNSRLSESMYDAGFTNVTNVDFSKVVIAHMLKANVRERPLMKWRVMDVANMQFANEEFDTIVDKGGLDTLMESKSPRSVNLYLAQVKRLLKPGGKYICITSGDATVIRIVLPRFRQGWKVSLYAIALGQLSGNLNQQIFMVLAEKLCSDVASEISLFLDGYSVESHGSQAEEFNRALDKENRLRRVLPDAYDAFTPLEDLRENLKELKPGRKLRIHLIAPGTARFVYNSILLDAPRDFGPFSVQFFVLLVTNSEKVNLEWNLSFSREQWLYAEKFKTARLLMVLLDSEHSDVPMADIQNEIFPLLHRLVPGDCDPARISFATFTDGIKQEETVHKVTSEISGQIVVDDVIYNEVPSLDIPGKDLIVRHITIGPFVPSKALVRREGPIEISSEVEKKKVHTTSKSKKKGKRKKSHSHSSKSHADASSGVLKVQHRVLLSQIHNAIISGIMLISEHLKASSSTEGLVETVFVGRIPLFKIKTVIIGLEAGLLPMFMRNCLPYLSIEVAELDPMIVDIAREYFDFNEDERLKVHIKHGVEFVTERANCVAGNADGTGTSKIDILIVDVNYIKLSQNPLFAPPQAFIKESFLSTVKSVLSEEGIFIINLATRSRALKTLIYEKLESMFGNILTLQLDEDVNEVIFALNTDYPINEDHLSDACGALAKIFELENNEWSQKVIDVSKLIKPLRYSAEI